MKFSIIVSELLHEDIVNILSGAMTGCSYWCSDINYEKSEYELARNEYIKRSGKERPCYEDILAQILMDGKSLTFYDIEEDKEYTLVLATLKEGISKAIQDGISGADNFDEADDITYDCIIQYALFGDVVYG